MQINFNHRWTHEIKVINFESYENGFLVKGFILRFGKNWNFELTNQCQNKLFLYVWNGKQKTNLDISTLCLKFVCCLANFSMYEPKINLFNYGNYLINSICRAYRVQYGL